MKQDEKTEETITISKREYDRLIEQVEWLECLEAAGVDNWSGYEIAIDIQNGEDL